MSRAARRLKRQAEQARRADRRAQRTLTAPDAVTGKFVVANIPEKHVDAFRDLLERLWPDTSPTIATGVQATFGNGTAHDFGDGFYEVLSVRPLTPAEKAVWGEEALKLARELGLNMERR